MGTGVEVDGGEVGRELVVLAGGVDTAELLGGAEDSGALDVGTAEVVGGTLELTGADEVGAMLVGAMLVGAALVGAALVGVSDADGMFVGVAAAGSPTSCAVGSGKVGLPAR